MQERFRKSLHPRFEETQCCILLDKNTTRNRIMKENVDMMINMRIMANNINTEVSNDEKEDDLMMIIMMITMMMCMMASPSVCTSFRV